LGVVCEAPFVDLDDANPSVEDEKFVVHWRRAVLSRQHFLGIDRAMDVAVRPFAADEGVSRRAAWKNAEP
jgi:hypothetical protein